MHHILSPADCVGMEEDPVDFSVSIQLLDLVSDDELLLNASVVAQCHLLQTFTELPETHFSTKH